jgi:hypothetical protein
MLVGPHLTDANHREWLTAVAGKSKREVESFVATRSPKPNVPSSVRRLPRRQGSTQPPATDDDASDSDANASSNHVTQTATPGNANANRSNPDSASVSNERQDNASVGAANRPRVQPLSGSTFRIVLTGSEVLKQKLDRARELCSHMITPGDLPFLFERALDLLIEREEKRRYAVRSPKSPRSKPAGEILAARPPEWENHQEPDPAAPVVPTKEPEEPPRAISINVNEQPPRAISINVNEQPPRAISINVNEHPPPPATSVTVSEQVQVSATSVVVNEQPPPAIVVTKNEQPSPPVREVKTTERARQILQLLQSNTSVDAEKSQLICAQKRVQNSVGPLPIHEFHEHSRYVPAAVRRAVWERDGGQCAFIDDEGYRCTARQYLEIDHVDAYARGGATTIDNCRLACRAHNQYWAKLTFGSDFLARARSRTRTR